MTASASSSKRIFDFVVIGSGPAGHRAALQGAKNGKKVAIVEEYKELGGGCVHFGTLPSKSFRESVYRYALGSKGLLSQELGEGSVRPSRRAKKLELPDMKRLTRRKVRVVDGEAQVIRAQLKRNGVEILHGRGRFVSANEVEVQSAKGVERIAGTHFFIATGARPVASPPLVVDHRVVFDSDSILELPQMPRHLVVLGAGIIGCEYASMFATAGTQVVLVDRRTEILAAVDRQIVAHLEEWFENLNVETVLGVEATAIEVAADPASGASLTLSNGRVIQTEAVLVAQGRFGNTEGLGLTEIGIAPDARGLISVDANFRTGIPHIYAIGDVIGAPSLAATALEQGSLAACHALGMIGKPGVQGGFQSCELPAIFPYGIYTIPEISMIGRTEEDLVRSNADFVAGIAPYRELARGQIVGDRWGLLKILVDRESLRILGVHIIGDSAANLIHIGQAVMSLGGTIEYFIQSVFNYPTLAEAYKVASFHAMNQIRGLQAGPSERESA